MNKASKDLLDLSPAKECLIYLAMAAEEEQVDALTAYVALKEIEEYVKNVMDQVKDAAIEIAEASKDKQFTLLGHKVTVKNGAGTWDYKGVSSHVLLKKQLKQIEEMSKSVANGGDPVFDKDGVEIEPAAYKAGATTIAVTLDKKAI